MDPLQISDASSTEGQRRNEGPLDGGNTPPEEAVSVLTTDDGTRTIEKKNPRPTQAGPIEQIPVDEEQETNSVDEAAAKEQQIKKRHRLYYLLGAGLILILLVVVAVVVATTVPKSSNDGVAGIRDVAPDDIPQEISPSPSILSQEPQTVSPTTKSPSEEPNIPTYTPTTFLRKTVPPSTLVSTMPATTSSAPTPEPTSSPSHPITTSRPTTSSPTSSPTTISERTESPIEDDVLNDSCETAIGPLKLGEIVNGTTSLAAIVIGNAPSCGDAYSQTSPGLWYSVDAAAGITSGGNTTMMLTTLASFDVQVSVFGSSCSQLECIAGENFPRDSPSVVWQSHNEDHDSSMHYYILVHGASPRDVGDFTMIVGERAKNDLCDNAENLTASSSSSSSLFESDVVVWGDTRFAILPDLLRAASCGGASWQSNQGLWYTIGPFAQDRALSATTCDVQENYFQAQISVFRGNSCGVLSCVTGAAWDDDDDDDDDDSDGNMTCSKTGTRVTWWAKANETYTLLIHGYSSGPSHAGPFVLRVCAETTDVGMIPTLPPTPVVPYNTKCPDAENLVVYEPITATTLGAVPRDSHALECGWASSQISLGVWFRYTPADQSADGTFMMGLTTCNATGSSASVDSFARQVSVFTGTCEKLECVTGHYYDRLYNCDGEVGLTWQAQRGVTYYILVHGKYLGSAGPFFLTIGQVPTNDDCTMAVPLTRNSVVSGSTDFAKWSSPYGACGSASSNSRGVWYSYTNTLESSEAVVATTCIETQEGDGASVDLEMTVFTGSCDYELLCLDGSNTIPEGSCSQKEAGVAWLAEPGETYFIQIHHGSHYSFRGNFSLVVQPTLLPIIAPDPLPVPPNDNCSGAIELSSTTGKAIEGTTVGASFFHKGEACSPYISEAPGVFYWTRATSNRTDVSLVGIPSGTSFWPYVWQGGSCDQLVLQCRRTYYHSSGNYSFDSTEGETYYILVKRSYRAVTGNFLIGIQ